MWSKLHILNANENMDQPVWKLASSNGALTFKEARLYVKENPPDVAWYKPL